MRTCTGGFTEYESASGVMVHKSHDGTIIRAYVYADCINPISRASKWDTCVNNNLFVEVPKEFFGKNVNGTFTKVTSAMFKWSLWV